MAAQVASSSSGLSAPWSTRVGTVIRS
jgi:hypothetical protein